MENGGSEEPFVIVQSYMDASITVYEDHVDKYVIQTGSGNQDDDELLAENHAGLDATEHQSAQNDQVGYDDGKELVESIPYEIDASSKEFLKEVASTPDELSFGCFWRGCKWFVYTT